MSDSQVFRERMIKDHQAFKSSTVRYWERRRLIYNLALVPPSLFTYLITAGVSYAGDPHETYYTYVLFLFVMSALGANILYTLAYAAEFLIGDDAPSSRWMRFGRSATFASGLTFAMLLAFIGGRNIAVMEFHYGLSKLQ